VGWGGVRMRPVVEHCCLLKVKLVADRKQTLNEACLNVQGWRSEHWMHGGKIEP